MRGNRRIENQTLHVTQRCSFQEQFQGIHETKNVVAKRVSNSYGEHASRPLATEKILHQRMVRMRWKPRIQNLLHACMGGEKFRKCLRVFAMPRETKRKSFQ